MFDAVANSRVDRQRVDGRNETSDLIGTTRSAVPGNGRVKEEYTTPSLNPNFVADNVEAAAPTFSSEPTWNTGEQDENGSVIGAKKKINNGIEVDAQHDSRHISNDARRRSGGSASTLTTPSSGTRRRGQSERQSKVSHRPLFHGGAVIMGGAG